MKKPFGKEGIVGGRFLGTVISICESQLLHLALMSRAGSEVHDMVV